MPLIKQFPTTLAWIENDLKSELEGLSLDSFSMRYQQLAQLEYFGKVPLNRKCAHGKPMEQLKMYAHSLSVQHMNELIEMGWRRDGNNILKTTMNCCHTYALRMDAHQFKLTRSHKKVLNHILDFFKYGHMEKNESSENFSNQTKPSKKGKQNNPNDFTLDAYMNKIYANCEAHTLEARLVKPSSSQFDESYEESFKLYAKYQEYIHKNKLTNEDFENALASTPFTLPNEPRLQHCGTFHRQYLIDGKLVGVDVFDILPNYVLGQTLYYDPDFMHLNLGTFMILNQILFTQQLAESVDCPLYFSSGLYNHCFKKHHYKLQFATEILCCDTQTWIPLDKKLLEKLETEEKIICETPCTEKPTIFSLSCLYNGKVVKYGKLQEILTDEHRDTACQRFID